MFGKIKRIFKQLKEESDIVERKAEITSEKVTFDELLTQINNWVNREPLTEEWILAFSYYQNHPEWKERLDNALKGIVYSNLPENINSENIQKIYGDTVHTSVSKLEQYSSCAFSYYLKYTLGLKEKEQAKVQAVDTGSFLHDLIAHFLEYIKQETIQLKEITEKQIEQIIDELIKEKLNLEKNEIFHLNKKYQFLVIRLRKLLKTALLHIIESLKYSEFEILGNEIEFKQGKHYPPIQINLENGKRLELEGKIDRVDFAKTEEGKFIRIIDYKSSVKNLDLNEIEYGLQLQLFTYLDSICKNDDYLPAGVLYFSLIDPVIKADHNMQKEEIEQEIRKRFKMQGFVLSDVKVVKMMDNTIETGASSRIPIYLDKDGNISSSKSNCLSKEQFELLQKHIEKTIKKIGLEMTEGKIDIRPYYQMKDKKTPCKYCPYHSICQIENNLDKVSYQYIPNQKKEEIFERLTKRKEDNYENKLPRN